MSNLEKEKIKARLKNNPTFYTSSLILEISNICNYASVHPVCPAHYFKEKKTMSLGLIEKILKDLKDLNWDKLIWPFCYSEPLIDPRFFTIASMVGQYLPKTRIGIYTNGFFMDINLLRDLVKFNLGKIIFSAYTPEEQKRFRALIADAKKEKLPLQFRITRRYPMTVRMSDKINWYDRKPVHYHKACKAPFRFLNINVDGNLIICCHDWKAYHQFGSLKTQSLRDILLSDKMLDTFVALKKNERDKYFLCARCTKRR